MCRNIGRIPGFAGDRAIRFNSSAPAGLPVFPLLSLARAKNGILAVFHLRVLQSKTQEIVDAGILPLRLLRKQLAAPAAALFSTESGAHLW
jgi:hypothetical protein